MVPPMVLEEGLPESWQCWWVLAPYPLCTDAASTNRSGSSPASGMMRTANYQVFAFKIFGSYGQGQQLTQCCCQKLNVLQNFQQETKLKRNLTLKQSPF